mgnify:FL=1
MKRFLLWVVGVILGVAVLLGAVMTVSYSFTGEGSCPAADTQFGGQALEVNGSCWQVPLLGGVFDKVFTSPETLTVQKLGVLYDAHPALALPDWASYTTLTIETDIGSIVFAGSASQYEDFLFPANGDYKAKLTVWRLPQDYLATQFEGGTTGAIRKNLGVEHPAKPTGWYSYSFRFTLQASAEVALSTERLEQGIAVLMQDETLRTRAGSSASYGDICALAQDLYAADMDTARTEAAVWTGICIVLFAAGALAFAGVCLGHRREKAVAWCTALAAILSVGCLIAMLAAGHGALRTLCLCAALALLVLAFVAAGFTLRQRAQRAQ